MGTVLFLVYLAGVAGALKVASIFALIFAAIGGFVGAMFCSVELDDMAPFWKIAKIARPYVIGALVVAVFAPSTQLLYIAAGMKAGQEVAQTAIAQKAYTLLDKKLDELLGSDGQQ